MTKDEALESSIEALENLCEGFLLGADWRGVAIYDDTVNAIKACKEALEQPAQEPVAWMHRHAGEITEFNDFQSCQYCEPLYTHPHQWQGLTDDEIEYWECLKAPPVHPDFLEDDSWREFARCIEAKLKEKNT
jgi:hypothetical protein